MFKRDWAPCPKFVHYDSLSSQHSWRHLYKIPVTLSLMENCFKPWHTQSDPQRMKLFLKTGFLPQFSCAYWVLMTTHTELPFLCIQIPHLTNTHVSGAQSQAGSPVFDSSKFSFTWCSNVRTRAQCNGNTKQQSWEVLFTILLGHTKLIFCNFLSFTMQQSWCAKDRMDSSLTLDLTLNCYGSIS